MCVCENGFQRADCVVAESAPVVTALLLAIAHCDSGMPTPCHATPTACLTVGSLRVEAELTKLQSLAGGGTVKFRQLKAYINNVSVLCYRCVHINNVSVLCCRWCGACARGVGR